MHPKSPVKRLLVDHPTGSGKTREMIKAPLWEPPAWRRPFAEEYMVDFFLVGFKRNSSLLEIVVLFLFFFSGASTKWKTKGFKSSNQDQGPLSGCPF